MLKVAFIGLSVMPLLNQMSQDARLSIGTLIAFIIAFTSQIKPLPKLVGALFVCVALSVKYGFLIDYKPILEIVAYGLMYSAVSKGEAEKCLPVIVWCGAGLAMYGILQFFGFESLHIIDANNTNAIHTPSFQVSASLGHPIYLGALLAMLMPLGMKIKKYWAVVVMGICVLMTKSDMAIGAMVISMASIYFLDSQKKKIILVVLGVLVCAGFVLNSHIIESRSSSRFSEWSTILKNHNKGMLMRNAEGQELYKKFNLFGNGAGSFAKMYPLKISKNNFNYAHNEFLQIYWEFGVITLILFTAFLLLQIFSSGDKFIKASILCISLNALGLFVWQLGLLRIVSVYLLCLNKQE